MANYLALSAIATSYLLARTVQKSLQLHENGLRNDGNRRMKNKNLYLAYFLFLC